MVRLQSMDDFMSLPKTKLNITQPADDDEREDVFQTGVYPFHTANYYIIDWRPNNVSYVFVT